MNLRECFEKRLLKRVKPDTKKALQSLEVARKKLILAENALNAELFEACIIYGYTAMFHAARALLFKDGVVEKSHICTAIYLREKYSQVIPLGLINSLEVHRAERHEALYGLEFKTTKEDCEALLEDAKDFIKVVEKIIKYEKTNFQNIEKNSKRF